jgi:predicted MPP superfamily phosphohydrolase
MAARYLTFFAVASLVLGLAHRYVWARLVRDAALPQPWSRLAVGVLIALFVTLLASFVAARALPRGAAAPVTWVGYTWLGVLFFLVVSLGLSDLVRGLSLRAGALRAPTDLARRQTLARLFGGVAAAAGIGASAVGLASVLGPVAVRRVRVVVDGLARSRSGYRIVQISDVHVGPTIGRGFLEGVVRRINELEPDLVAITGDLVDGSVHELAAHVAPLADLSARDGVFFVTGNHEYYSGVESWLAHLATLGVRVLRNEHVRIGGDDGFDLAGIDDASSHGYGHGHGADLARALAGRDPSRPCVLLAHQPKGIDLADARGVDLQLSGHTHGGQMIPWNLLVRLQQPFVAGLHRLRRAQIYVSCGTGYWGPPMRVGAPAEITEIELHSASS